MLESKIVLTERLRREGRWGEASKFKENTVNELRAGGMKRAEAVEEAWSSMADAFPPLLGGKQPVDTGDPAKELPTSAGPIPWCDLPTEGNFDDEVRWVHQQYILIVEDSSCGRVIQWDRATTKPPSIGACSLARWAAENRTAFYKDLLPKTIARSDGQRRSEEDIVEDPDLEDVEEMLQQMQDRAEAELRANLPEVLQRRVGRLLANWSQEHGVSLTGDSLAGLDLGVRRLLDDALRTFTSMPKR
jgi:hypothetical protein